MQKRTTRFNIEAKSGIFSLQEFHSAEVQRLLPVQVPVYFLELDSKVLLLLRTLRLIFVGPAWLGNLASDGTNLLFWNQTIAWVKKGQGAGVYSPV